MVWDGGTDFKYAAIEEERTKAHWKKWAESAFEPPGKGMKWKIKIDNMKSHYVIMIVPTQED